MIASVVHTKRRRITTCDALIDDGTCELTTANPCPTDLNGDGTTSVSDLLILLGAFATDCE